MCCCCSVKQQKIWTFGIALLFLLLGILFAAGGPSAVRSIIKSELVLTPGTRAYGKWAVTPIPVYLNMYLFNWTNPEQVRVPGIKPNFVQMGPYIFSQRTSKEDLTYYENNTVSFRNKRVWTWEPEMSTGTLEDKITAPHLPTVAAAAIMRDYNRPIKRLFNSEVKKNGGALYQTHTVNEWLFEGFEDQLIKYASKLPIGIDFKIYKERFGWFYGRNSSKAFEGVFTVNTGANDISKLGELLLWRNKSNTGFFEGECGKLNGSTSDIFPPNQNHIDPITIFVMDTTRIINLYPTTKQVNVEGIEGVRYETTMDTYDNGQRNEAMTCYCKPELRPDNCPPSGATSITAFIDNVPLFLSNPNFLYADPHYAETITGLTPNFERDIFTISLESSLSIPLEIQANVQVSLKIQKDNELTIMKDLPEYFYAPMFIVCNKATLPPDIAREVKLALSLPNIVRYIGYGFMLFGLLLFIIGGILSKTNNWAGGKNYMSNSSDKEILQKN